LKIALSIPCNRQTEAKFTQCLADMIAFTMSRKIEFNGEPVTPEIRTTIIGCSMLTESRNRLVLEALNWGADFMLWMDADHVFPQDALLRLLSHNLMVVGCNYARRFDPTSPTASRVKDDGKYELVWTTQETAQRGDMESVAHMGLGLCLMDMRVFDVLEHVAVKEGKKHFWPLFRMDPKEDGIGVIGEDVYFFQRIRDAGIHVVLDHNLSWDVGHLHEKILTNAHCEIQKNKWVEYEQHKLDKFKKEPAA
jgi:hypothetical protein